MFKKFLDYFVEDEEDEFTRDEMIEPVRKNVSKNDKQVIYKKVEANTEEVKPIIKEKQKRLEVDDIEIKSVQYSVKKDIQKTTTQIQDKYVFNPPMSPIFGVIGDEIEKNELKAKTQANSVNTPSQIGTIISPIYGKDEDNDIDNMINNLVDNNQQVDSYYSGAIKQENFSLDDLLKSSIDEVTQDYVSDEEVDNITLFDKG